MQTDIVDVFVIGGGVNGCGIARDAAGRGLSVMLVEQGDLASGTSSASTKLFHGGLRYLEFFEFRLVREALKEREVLLNMMPHISWPMRFVLPLSADLRFDSQTPVSRFLARIMPWTQGRRPNWTIRLGLFLYDYIGGRKLLPATRKLALSQTPEGDVLGAKFKDAFEYSDVWVDDSRLVSLNARDAAERGAHILTRCRFISAARVGDCWEVVVEQSCVRKTYHARSIVNAAGPWVAKALKTLDTDMQGSIRLVRGSHIVLPKLYEHDKCYFLQGDDGRICFVIPYEQDFTLIGTTDADHGSPDVVPEISRSEKDYLIDFVNKYLDRTIHNTDIVWAFSGVRALQDVGEVSASAATRDYELRLEGGAAPLLTVFGGKITTYRKLSEAAVDKLAPDRPAWTKGVSLPGGGFAVADKPAIQGKFSQTYPFLTLFTVRRLINSYGLDAFEMFAGAKEGHEIISGLDFRELEWLVEREFAQSAEDVLWRRTKLGLRVGEGEFAKLEAYMKELKALK